MEIHPARVLVIVLQALLLAACAIPQPLPISRVMEQGRNGAGADSTIEAMRFAKTSYALRGADFARLGATGVSPEVLDYIQQSFIDDVDLLTRYWVLGESIGGCARCVPVEVDLADMSRPRERSTSTALRFDQPQGMPSWYRPYSVRRGTITLGQVQRMSASGVAEGDILQALRSANLEPVVGVGGLGPIRTRPAAGLTGSRLAQLAERGVSERVLDELQIAFLSQFVEVERLRYQNLGKGPGGSFN